MHQQITVLIAKTKSYVLPSLFTVSYFVLVSAIAIPGYAQTTDFITPDQPWTVVTHDDLPPGLTQRLVTYEDTIRVWEEDSWDRVVRFIYPVRIHLEEVDLPDYPETDTFLLQVPRDPGRTDTVPLIGALGVYVDSVGTSRIVSGSYEGTDTNIRFCNLFFGCSDRSGDTTCDGSLQFCPDFYTAYAFGRIPGFNRFGYFVQFVHSVWHPALPTSTTEPDDKNRDSRTALKLYPTILRSGQQLRCMTPQGWPTNVPLSVRVYGPAGQRMWHGRTKLDVEGLTIGIDWPPGTYHLAAYASEGRLATGRFVVE